MDLKLILREAGFEITTAVSSKDGIVIDEISFNIPSD